MKHSLPPGALPTTYHVYERGAWTMVETGIVEERAVCIYVNGQELATYQCSPIDQEAMALGFLRAEGFIDSLADVEMIKLSHGGGCVDVWLKGEIERPRRVITTSGCSGGITFDDLTRQRPPLTSPTTASPQQIMARFDEMRGWETLYPLTRGIHTSALCTPDRLLLVAEDVGRHNTLDKLWGKAMQQGISTEGCILVSTGRISSEMLGKAAKMGAPIVASRTSPTSRSVALAQAWNIAIIGYLRRDSLRVYSALERIAVSS